MSVGPRSRTAARPGRGLVISLFVVAALAGCSGYAPGSPDPTIVASGFPVGHYVKAFVEPQFGPGRIAWTFEADGRWAEIPLEGAPMGATPVRGSYAVTGDILTITTDYPPGFGASRHTWLVTDGQLWTSYRSSDVDEDAEWFALLDPFPWIPLE